MASVGVDRRTGRLLTDFDHVVQSIEVIFTTRLGERVMRRHFGSTATALLGKLQTPVTIIQFFALITIAIEIWEPRFRVAKISLLTTSPETVRQGTLTFQIEGEYRPRGHLGDPTPDSTRRVPLVINGDRVSVAV